MADYLAGFYPDFVEKEEPREIILKLGKMITNRLPVKLGLQKLNKYDPEYWGLAMLLTDEQAELALKMGVRQPKTMADLVKLSGSNLSVADNRSLNTLLYTINDIERIADHALAIAKAGQEMAEKKICFSEAAKKELEMLEKATVVVIQHTICAFVTNDLEQAMKVEPQQQVVNAMVKEIKSRHIRRLRDGQCTVEYGFVLDDLLTAYQRSAAHCSNVAVEMLQVSEGKLEAHEYLNALKAGELQESAQYAERFDRYKKQYEFPEE